MKKFLLIAGALLIVLVAAAGFAIYRANDVVARLKPRIEGMLGNMTGAHVTLGDLNVQVIPATEIRVEKVELKSSPEAKESLTLGGIGLDVDLWKLLSSELVVTSLVITSPSVTVVKTADGSYIEGLQEYGKQPKPRDASAPAPETNREPKKQLQVALDKVAVRDGMVIFDDRTSGKRFTIDRLALDSKITMDGPVTELLTTDLKARVENLPVSVRAKSIRADNTAKTISLASADASLLGGKITLAGTSSFDAKNGTLQATVTDIAVSDALPIAKRWVPDADKYASLAVVLEKMIAKIDLATSGVQVESLAARTAGGKVGFSGSIDARELRGKGNLTSDGLDLAAIGKAADQIVPQLVQYRIAGKIVPKLEVSFGGSKRYQALGPVQLSGVSAFVPGGNPLDVKDLNGIANLAVDGNGQQATFEKLMLTVKDLALSADGEVSLNPREISASKLSVTGFGGTFSAPFSLNFDPSLTFSAQPRIAGADITKLLELAHPPTAGLISGTLALYEGKTAGTISPLSLRGPGRVRIDNGLLKGMNIGGAVLKKLDNLPFLPGAASAIVPLRFKPFVDSPDTVVKSLTSDFDLEGTTIRMKKTRLESDHFLLETAGTYSMSGEMDLDALITFSKEFSAALAESAKDVKKVLSPEGQLIVPLSLKGTAPNIIVTPDVKKLIEVGARTALGERAEKEIDRVLQKQLGGGAASEGAKKALEGLLGF